MELTKKKTKFKFKQQPNVLQDNDVVTGGEDKISDVRQATPASDKSPPVFAFPTASTESTPTTLDQPSIGAEPFFAFRTPSEQQQSTGERGSILAAKFGLVVSSAERTPEENIDVGGKPNSFHLASRGALAVDIAGPSKETLIQDRHSMDKLFDFLSNDVGEGKTFKNILDEGDHIHVVYNKGETPEPIDDDTIFESTKFIFTKFAGAPPTDEMAVDSVGDVWARGFQNALAGGSDLFGFLDELTIQIAEEVGLERGGLFKVFETFEEDLQRRSDKIHAAPATGIYARPPEDIGEFFDYKRIYKALGENIPLMGGLAAATVINPVLGGAIIFGVEAGGTLDEIEQRELETGVQISDAEKLLASSTAGALNAALEFVGLRKILGIAKATGWKRKIFELLTSVVVESATEPAQEFITLLASMSAVDGTDLQETVANFTEKDFDRLKEAFYAGFATSLVGGSAIASIPTGPTRADIAKERLAKPSRDPKTGRFTVRNPPTVEELQKDRNAFVRFWDKVVDTFDIENSYKKVGLAQTGLHIKTFFGFQESVEDFAAQRVLRPIRKLIKKKDMADLLLLREDKDAFVKLFKANPNDPRIKAIEILDNYFKATAKERKYFKVQQQTLKEELTEAVRDWFAGLQKQALQKGKAVSNKNLRKLTVVMDQLKTMKYIPMPHSLMQAMAKNVGSGPTPVAQFNGINRVMKILEKHGRVSMSLTELLDAGLIEKSDINLGTMLAEYSNKHGKDIGLARIAQVAIREGAMKKVSNNRFSTKHWMKPPTVNKAFDGFQVNSMLNSSLDALTRDKDKLGLFRRSMNIVKMAAFANPVFLPLYDVLQSAMVGATFNPLHPIRTFPLIGTNYIRGILDVALRRDAYYEAGGDGLSSKNYSNPLRQTNESFAKIYDGKLAAAFKPFTTTINPFKLGQRSLKALYNISWDTAWTMDRVVRQATYHFFLQKGFTIQDAAQMSAKVHADYAAIPDRTRKGLNTFFFTPSFKIAMGKFFISAIDGAGKIATGKATNTHRAYAGVLLRTTAIIVAYDMLMKSLGFEEEDFGRKYVRKDINIHGVPREFVISWSGPHNLWLKYTQRVLNVLHPSQPNPALALGRSMGWELHPVYRIGWEMLTNEAVDGADIYEPLDPLHIKMANNARYFTTQTIRMFSRLSEHEAGSFGRRALEKDIGTLWANVLNSVSFMYTRDIKEIRFKNQINRMIEMFDEGVGGSQFRRKLLSTGLTDEELDEYLANQPRRIKNWEERMDKLVNEFQDDYFSYDNMMDDLIPTKKKFKFPTPPEQEGTAAPDIQGR